MKSKTLIAISLAALMGFSANTNAGIQIVKSYVDDEYNVTVIGDASRLGVTTGYGNRVPYEHTLKILFPKWKILNSVQGWPPLIVSWRPNTPRIDILKEMNSKAGLIFYVDTNKKEIVIDFKPERKP